MSYCRFYEGEAYVARTVQGYIACYGCKLSDKLDDGMHDTFKATTYSAMINHIQQHIDAGHIIPDRAIKKLKHEQKRVGDEIKPFPIHFEEDLN